MDNKNKSLWDEMVSEVKKEFTPKAVQACDEENQEAAAEFTFLGLTVLIAFIAFAIV